jgi:hypothetical protein
MERGSLPFPVRLGIWPKVECRAVLPLYKALIVRSFLVISLPLVCREFASAVQGKHLALSAANCGAAVDGVNR